MLVRLKGFNSGQPSVGAVITRGKKNMTLTVDVPLLEPSGEGVELALTKLASKVDKIFGTGSREADLLRGLK